MIKLDIGTTFNFADKKYKVVENLESSCVNCELRDTWVCTNINCTGIIFKQDKEVLTVEFKIVDNIILYKVVSQDKGWFSNHLTKPTTGPVRCMGFPELVNGVIYIRGTETYKDNKTVSCECETNEEAIETLDNLINRIEEKYVVNNRVGKDDWIRYEIIK